MNPLHATLWLSLVCLAGGGPGGPSERTLEVDAVRLLEGREVPGRPSITLERYGFVYQFESEATRDRFARDPERFEVQLGGACARMGPLSGLGSADIRAVHGGKLYVFASEACREGFLKDPDALLPAPDPLPEGDEAARAAGRELVDRAVRGMGGEAALDCLRTFSRTAIRLVDHNGTLYSYGKAWICRFPDQIRRETWWSEPDSGSGWKRVDLLTPEGDWVTRSDEGTAALHPQQAEAVRAELQRMPIAILSARKRPDFVAVAAGADGDRSLVDVAFGGTTTRLAIEPDTNRIVVATFRGRGPSMRYGEVTLRFSSFTDHEGLVLADRVTKSFEGEPVPSEDVTWSTTRVNTEMDAGLFRR